MRRFLGISLLKRLLAIFSTGTNGYIYDPSDMASLYQDSAGTTPVTAVTNPVGKVSDKSGNTNHALQATAAARPTWTNRVNLLTYTEQFANAAWTSGASFVQSAGANGFTKLAATAVSTQHVIYQMFSVTIGDTRAISCVAKQGEARYFYITAYNGSAWRTSVFDLLTGTVTQQATDCVATIVQAADGYTCLVVFTAPATTASCYIYFGQANASTWSHGSAWSGDGVSGFYLKHVQFELGTTATTYQRVTTATDFDTAGFPYYLSFLGTDDFLSSATGGGGSAGFFWCGAVLPTGGAGTYRVLYDDHVSAKGYILYISSTGKLDFYVGYNVGFINKASTATVNVGTKYMLTVWDDGVNLNVQIGDAAAETVARPVVVAGTAGYKICRDNPTADYFFIGNLYASVYFCNTAGTAAQRATVQAWVKQKAGIV